MFLKITIKNLSPNDADYFIRNLTAKGAKGRVVFEDETSTVIVSQNGNLEKLLETASISFHASDFHTEIFG